VIPSNLITDLSTQYKLGAWTLKAGCNNLTNRTYFTKRADEYPGPGIIPSQPRSFYVGVSAVF
jgi:Fe(3+) dicitrate transport protein